MLTLYIDGQLVDIYLDEDITLTWQNAMLGDLSSLKTNFTYTLKLPKTTLNDSIFDFANYPSYDSEQRHKILPCRFEIDGITIAENGRCHLLDSSGDVYEISLTWGMLDDVTDWLNKKSKLKDLKVYDEDYIPWNDKSAVLGGIWYGGITRTQPVTVQAGASMFYGGYDSGVNLDVENNRIKCNIHPFVTVREIYERILNENNLKIKIPSEVLFDMENNAIVLTKNNNTTMQQMTQNFNFLDRGLFEEGSNVEKWFYFRMTKDELFNNATSSFIHSGYGSVSVTLGELRLRWNASNTDVGATGFINAGVSQQFSLMIKERNGDVIEIDPVSNQSTLLYNVNRTFTIDDFNDSNNGEWMLELRVKMKRWSSLPVEVWNAANDITFYGGNTGGWSRYSLRDSIVVEWEPGIYTYEGNDNSYPLSRFNLVENLPDITQLDFLKMVMNMYGLFPLQKEGAVELIRLDSLTMNIESGNCYDWSDRLTDSHHDVPREISYKVGDYARRNIIRYKEDKNELRKPTQDSDVILIDNLLLDAEKVIVEFPFAASRGDAITQYEKSANGDIEAIDVEYRLMRVIWANGYNILYFDNSLKPKQIVNRYYGMLKKIIEKPLTIEEDIQLEIYELKEIDYSKPVYLSKYGRYFAIERIEFNSKKTPCEVKLILIR